MNRNAAGIDVSSKRSTVAVLRPFGEIVKLPFDVRHSAEDLIALQEQSFPGIRKLFDSPVRSDGTQKWVDFTHNFWHVDCVRSGSQKAFTDGYRKWCKRNRYQSPKSWDIPKRQIPLFAWQSSY